MAAQRIGEYVSKGVPSCDEAVARLTAPQQIAREISGLASALAVRQLLLESALALLRDLLGKPYRT